MVHYGWALAPIEHRALAWNIGGAAARVVLLLALVSTWQINRPLLVVLAFWLAEETMVIACSGAYIVNPWPVPPGQAMCSSLLHFDLGQIGALAIALILLVVPTRPSR